MKRKKSTNTPSIASLWGRKKRKIESQNLPDQSLAPNSEPIPIPNSPPLNQPPPIQPPLIQPPPNQSAPISLPPNSLPPNPHIPNPKPANRQNVFQMDPKKKKEYKEIAKNIKLIKRKSEGKTDFIFDFAFHTDLIYFL